MLRQSRLRRSPVFLAPLMIWLLFRRLIMGFGWFLIGGTLLSFVRTGSWVVRMWDFPRLQVATVATALAALFTRFCYCGRRTDITFLTALTACGIWQGWKILRYTPIWPNQVKGSRGGGKSGCTFRLLMSNVLMENTDHQRLLKVIRDYQPDIILAVETNARWAAALEPLARTYPYVVRKPQENYYGLMLFSRIELIDPEIQFLVQDDVPSVHCAFELPGGGRVHLHGLHPRPPEPIRDQDSTPRDAELVIMGRAIGEAGHIPTVVAGDLNDVAWSPTSELFMRLSGLLDPRIGRGLYNSYNAHTRIWRYPLDHVFHSNHFRLVSLERLPYIGSDHFPMCIELSLEPDAPLEQPKTEEEDGDQEIAEEKLEEQAEAAATGDDRPGRE